MPDSRPTYMILMGILRDAERLCNTMTQEMIDEIRALDESDLDILQPKTEQLAVVHQVTSNVFMARSRLLSYKALIKDEST